MSRALETVMPSPFPGMDPYIENPSRFPDFHHEMISGIRAHLNRAIRPKYVALIEERVYVSTEDDPGRRFIIPDVEIQLSQREDVSVAPFPANPAEPGIDVAEPIVATASTLIDSEIHEAFVNVVDVETKAIVTVIEVLSPTNKCVGAKGRKQYLRKRRGVLRSDTHLVEIDLLREGKSTFDRDILPPHHYAVCVSRHELRPKAKFWPIVLQQRLPPIEIPLQSADPEVPLDLQAIFTETYERGSYDLVIDYQKPANPPLPQPWSEWAESLCGRK